MIPYFLTFVATTIAVWTYVHWRNKYEDLRSDAKRAKSEAKRLTDQHQSDLAHERAQQAALFDCMAEGVLMLDAEGRVSMFNQALERLFGLSGNIKGQTVTEAFRIIELQEIVDEAWIDGRVLAAELELPGLDTRFLQVNATKLLDRQGDTEGMLLIFHDLTRIKELENTRKDFVANVSHELRTPLSMIKSYAETLIDGAMDDPAVSRKFLLTIDKHADRLTYLIEDLLAISRLESGQANLRPQPILLYDLVQGISEDLQERATEREMRFDILVPETLMVKADSEKLEQVLVNLMDNAVKYGRPGGSIKVGAEVNIAGAVQAYVEDNGPGIPADAMERIFERFYRIDTARSREQGGTGLGLSIVKHIIQSHGGEVWVENASTGGARFVFTLPLEGVAPAPEVVTGK